MREQAGADHAMGYGEHGAHGACKSVNRSQFSVGQCQPSEQTGNGHVFHRIPPLLIMRGFFVSGWIIRCSVDFNKNEPRGIIQLLNNIKSRDAGLQNTVPGIFQGCLLKIFNTVRLYMNKTWTINMVSSVNVR